MVGHSVLSNTSARHLRDVAGEEMDQSEVSLLPGMLNVIWQQVVDVTHGVRIEADRMSFV